VSARRVVVRSIAWLDGLMALLLNRDIPRIIRGNIDTRAIIERVKLIPAVVALREMKRAIIARMNCVIAATAGTAQPTTPATVAATSKHRIHQEHYRDADDHREHPRNR
jgi:hypothetical protein